MSWHSVDRSDSDSEMLRMTSRRMQEDDSRVRLLSVSDDEAETEEPSSRDAGLPQLQFRRNNRAANKEKEEKKTRCAVISILVVGVILIVIINVGIRIKLKNDSKESPVMPQTCPEEEHQDITRCPASFPWQKYRLPRAIKPIHYDIFLHPNLTEGNYTGRINITINVETPTNMIVLHSKESELMDVSVYEDPGKSGSNPNVSPLGSHYVVCKEYEFLAIIMNGQLSSGQKYIIHIQFNSDLGKSMRGFYHSKYRTRSGDNRTIATTQFESTDARSAFPCFDEPDFKATFTLSIVRDEERIALSNMPIERTENMGNNLKLDKFQKTVNMSTYLVAFIVCDFESVTKTIQLQNGNVKVSVYAAKDKVNTAAFALNVSCDVLKFYEKAFGVAYPLPKLDLVAIPDFEAGAMENWGLVTYRETVILWNKDSSSIFDQEYVAEVIAHELSHQWFGNLVTMKWWNDLWLNEGFASYMEFYGVNGIKPNWHRMEQFSSDHTFSAMSTDESEYTHPITVPVDSKVQIEELFDSISYSKAGCVIAMMIDYLGADAFLGGVSNYLKAFAYGNAENRDLVQNVAGKANSAQQSKNVLDMLDSWTKEPGFPVVNVSLGDSGVVMSQMRYLLSVENDEDPNCHTLKRNSVWHIPVSYMTDSSKTKEWIFFENETSKFSLGGKQPKWAIFNIDRGGYYVVNYDKNLLGKLSAQLKTDHKVFSALDRSGILFNVAKSAKAGFVPYDSLLDLLSYLKKEEDYAPLSVGTDILFGILSTLKLQFETESYHRMQTYAKSLYKHLYTKYGWPDSNTADPQMSHLDIKVRRLAVSLMCSADDKLCTSEALDLFTSWKQNGTAVHPDYKSIVYSTAVRFGPPDYWEFMWDKYTSDFTLDESEKRKLLSALCHTKEEKKVVFLLDEAMKGENIRFQDTRSVFTYLQSTRIGGMIAWKYMRSNWDAILEIYPMGSFATQSLVNIFSSSVDGSDISAAEKFVSHNNMTNVRFVKRALDKAKLKVHWIKTYQPHITKWLAENVDKA